MCTLGCTGPLSKCRPTRRARAARQGPEAFSPGAAPCPSTISSASATVQPEAGCKTSKSTAAANPSGQGTRSGQQVDLAGQRLSVSEGEVLSSWDKIPKNSQESQAGEVTTVCWINSPWPTRGSVDANSKRDPTSNKVKGTGHHNADL